MIKVKVNPEVLKWAREEAGYEIDEIIRKTGASQYPHWEVESARIPINVMQEIAKSYKRQLAVFLLPEAPEKIPKPKDFRNLNEKESRLSKSVLFVLRKAVNLQSVARELQGVHYWEKEYRWLDELKALLKSESFNSHVVASWFRKKLEIDVTAQKDWENQNKAYNHWRQAVEEKLGILIFQFPMPKKQVQGFCLTDELPYVIVVNSSYRNCYSRIFTIFHELAHIIHHQSGMCLIDDVDEKQQEEYKCNSFAAKILIPETEVVSATDLIDIADYAGKLKVSREVYLRRLKDEELINPSLFFELLEEIRSTYREEGVSKRSGGPAPEVKSRASRGLTLYGMVLDAVNNNRVSYTQAAHYLDLRVNRVLNEI